MLLTQILIHAIHPHTLRISLMNLDVKLRRNFLQRIELFLVKQFVFVILNGSFNFFWTTRLNEMTINCSLFPEAEALRTISETT